MAKKILLLPASLKGHMVQFVQLAEFLASDYDVHIMDSDVISANLRLRVQVHERMKEELQNDLESKFAELAQTSKDWHGSIAGLLALVELEEVVGALTAVFGLVRKVKPDLVVSDATFNCTNHLHTLCRSMGVPLVVVICPGRPDPLLQVSTLLPLAFGHFSEILGGVRTLEGIKARMAETVGTALKDSDQPIHFLTGSKALVRAAPAEHQLFLGSVLPTVAPPGGGAPLPADLAAWLSGAEALGPVVYIAFGTLVAPGAELIQRLVEALKGGQWRVLWSLPASAHKLLPPGLDAGQWRVETSVPQIQVLQQPQVGCFLSHCGSNSVHEAMSNAVPMVCMPFYCDQYEWAASVCKYVGAGVQVDKLASSAADLRSAVTTVLDVAEYRQKAKAAAKHIRSYATALGKEYGVQADTAHQTSVAVAVKILGQLLEGKDPRAGFPAVKAAAQKSAAPPTSSFCTRCCG